MTLATFLDICMEIVGYYRKTCLLINFIMLPIPRIVRIGVKLSCVTRINNAVSYNE